MNPIIKRFFTALGLFFSTSASAATLILTDPASIPVPIPVPDGYHADGYQFPVELLEPLNPILSLEIDYWNSYAAPGDHEIYSANLLFNPAQVLSITNILSTPTQFKAVVQFYPAGGITEVSNMEAPAFFAGHGQIGGGALTSLIWTATYQDGSTRTAFAGIVPEPSITLLSLGSILLCLYGKRSR